MAEPDTNSGTADVADLPAPDPLEGSDHAERGGEGGKGRR
jgi:hypothetical protein